jgi:predicted nuclease with TOPRIM domain
MVDTKKVAIKVPALNLDGIVNLTPQNKRQAPTFQIKPEQTASELEEMRKELKDKDGQINFLRERLLELEDKVNTIQRDDKREKSQQKIKQSIKKLESCLKMFYQE